MTPAGRIARGRRHLVTLACASLIGACTVEIPPDTAEVPTGDYTSNTGDTGNTGGTGDTGGGDPVVPKFKPIAQPTVAVPEGVQVAVQVALADPDVGRATISASAEWLDDEGLLVTTSIADLAGQSGFDFDAGSGVATVTWAPAYTVVSAVGGAAEFTIRFTGRANGDESLQADATIAVTVRNDLDKDATADIDDDDMDGDGLANDVETGLADESTEPGLADSDGDGRCDGDVKPAQATCTPGDNCPWTNNPGQADLDGDGAGDDCDNCPEDFDNDKDKDKVCAGSAPGSDNCPSTPNEDQADADGDLIGDVCDDCEFDPDNDADGDEVCAFSAPGVPLDNCPEVDNQGQEDWDEDGLGDVCDMPPGCEFDADNDADDDGVCAHPDPDQGDNCPEVKNKDQADGDEDGYGDACDNCPELEGLDEDGDEYCGAADNCPTVENKSQQDSDGDGIGDACDECPGDDVNDPDGDGLCAFHDDGTPWDNCPNTANGAAEASVPGVGDQTDSDEDGLGDACDACPLSSTGDTDGDGVCDDADNCVGKKNGPEEPAPDGDQADIDEDGQGDACDDDDDGDGVNDLPDNCEKVANPDQQDLDDDDLGDACDEDDDGDGAADADDNCPQVANPLQEDVDKDAIGVACDDLVALPDGLYDNGADEVVAGTARGGSVALAFAQALDCAEVSGGCAAPGLFVLQGAEWVTDLDDWVDVNPSGRLQVPFVAQGGEVLLGAKPATASYLLDRIHEGEYDDSVSGVSSNLLDLPEFIDLPVGKTLVDAGEKLYEVGATGSGISFQSGTSFVDSAGIGAVRDGDYTLYQPSKSSTGKYSVFAYTTGGQAEAVFKNYTEVEFVASDPLSGKPWYCAMETSIMGPALVQLDGVAEVATLPLAGIASCADLVGRWLSPAGVWWLELDQSPGGPSHNLLRWQPGTVSAVNLLPGNAKDVEVWFAGPQTYVTLAVGVAGAGAFETRWYSTTSETPLALVGWDCDGLFQTGFVTGAGGSFGAVSRESDKGTNAALRACLTAGTADGSDLLPLGSALVSALKERWIDHAGVLYAHVTHGSTTTVSSVAKDASGGANAQKLFTTNGKALVSSAPGVTVIGIGGTDKGIYRATLLSGSATIETTKLATSLGPHQTFLATDGATDDQGGLWIAYNTAGSAYAVARATSGGFTALGFTTEGAPSYSAVDPDSGTPWFLFKTSAGYTMAQILGGQYTPWHEAAVEIKPITLATQGVDELWGARIRTAGAGGDHLVCALPPDGACWEIPALAGDTLVWGPVVTPTEDVYAVLIDSTSSVMSLWRNLWEPVTP